jgi:small subunit ribosomal protein S13
VARIAGVDIPRDKRVEVSLTYVYGIGPTRSRKILTKAGVSPDIRVKDLTDSDVQKLRSAAESFTLEGDLRREEGMALKRLQDIG